jgi:hypothetical protein
MKRFLRSVVLAFFGVVLGAAAPTANTPVANSSSVVTQANQGNPDVKVWVNTASGVYHCPGTRWYGATKQGGYMSQAEAQKKGYRPAYGKVWSTMLNDLGPLLVGNHPA